MTYKEVVRLCKVDRKTIARWVKGGKFPRPINLNGEIRWVASEVWVFVAKLMADREAGEALLETEKSDGTEGDTMGLSGTSQRGKAKRD